MLEIAGYNVNVVEFIGGEHTSKNTMNAATKQFHPRALIQLESMHDQLFSLVLMHEIYKQKLVFLLAKTLKKSIMKVNKEKHFGLTICLPFKEI